MRTLLIPEYVRSFACIGSECEDTCCKGWRVTVDKKTYMSYRKAQDPELRQTLQRVTGRNRQSKSDDSYGKIKLNDKGYCPLYTEEGLCGLQQKAGIEALPATCIDYPRTVNQVNGVLERSMTLSCPEVARLVLLNEDGLAFSQVEEPAVFDLKLSEVKEGVGREQLLWPLRIASIRLLQNRSTTLENRLIVLGLFLQKMEGLSLTEQLNQVEQTAVDYEQRLTNEAFVESLEQLPKNIEFQLRIGRDVLNTRMEQFNISSGIFRSVLGGMIKGLRLDETLSNEERVTIYEEAYDRYYKPYMSDHEYMFENYLVNHIFKDVFPFGNDSYIADYRAMITNYVLLKMLLVGTAQAFEGLNEQLVVQVFYSFSRSIEHNSKYKQIVDNMLDDIHCTTMGHMVTLIKN